MKEQKIYKLGTLLKTTGPQATPLYGRVIGHVVIQRTGWDRPVLQHVVEFTDENGAERGQGHYYEGHFISTAVWHSDNVEVAAMDTVTVGS